MRSGSWKRSRIFGAREVDLIPVLQSFGFRPLSEELPAGSDRLPRLSISRAHREGDASLCPNRRVFRFSGALRCPRFHRPGPAKG